MDSIEYCSSIFPALVVKGNVVIGISTSGRVPALSRDIREYLEKALPKDLEKIELKLEKLRESLPKGKSRQKLITKLALELISTSLPQHDI
ncbi:MAG: hypothetical protein ACK4UR_05655 [Caldimicrobium sp.]